MPHPEPMDTGIVVPVPELEEFTSRWRAQVDAVAPVGVPAHVTLLYPFIPPAEIERSTREELVEFFTARQPFEFQLTGVGRFGDDVVYLEPEPTEPFLDLTHDLMERWPEYPPYQDEFDEVVPHLTIGSGCSPEDIERVIGAVQPMLPVRSRARQVWLMVGRKDPPVWQVGDRFSLGHTQPAAVAE